MKAHKTNAGMGDGGERGREGVRNMASSKWPQMTRLVLNRGRLLGVCVCVCVRAFVCVSQLQLNCLYNMHVQQT